MSAGPIHRLADRLGARRLREQAEWLARQARLTLAYVDAERSDPHHCAFPASEAEFDAGDARIRSTGSGSAPGRITSGPVRSATCAAAGASASTTPAGTRSRSALGASPAKTPCCR